MSKRIQINPRTDILIKVDLQKGFMPAEIGMPGAGELVVPEAHLIIPTVNRLVAAFPRSVSLQDWHTPDHSSFAAQHAGKAPFEVVQMPYGAQTLWTVHCVANTPGAEIHPEVDLSKDIISIRKGWRREIDSYSGFRENDRTTSTGLAEALKAIEVERIFVVGITRPICVDFTAEDGARLGFQTFVVDDACSRLGTEADLMVSQERLEAQGVRFITADMILGVEPAAEPADPAAA